MLMSAIWDSQHSPWIILKNQNMELQQEVTPIFCKGQMVDLRLDLHPPPVMVEKLKAFLDPWNNPGGG